MDKAIQSAPQDALVRLLREHRERAGLRQSDVADRLSKKQSFVSKYESGERRIDYLEIRQICAAIGIDVVAFIQEYEASQR